MSTKRDYIYESINDELQSYEKLDAPASYDEAVGEMYRQMIENEKFVETAKKTLLECVNDLKVAGFTKEQIVSFIK